MLNRLHANLERCSAWQIRQSRSDTCGPAMTSTVIPDWVYTDETIYAREVERIFHGPTWNYVALEAEIANPGDYIRSNVGPTPVVVARAEDGSISVVENRCMHRAAEFCRELSGTAKEFICPYHQWTYDLKGNLIGVPFRRGVAGKGGMPADFKPAEHGLRRLNVTTHRGVVFASYSDDVEPFADYLGPEVLREFEATFDGRRLTVLGHYRHSLPGNWKLYHENLKDPYHATLLHTFLVTFGLLVAGNRSLMLTDRSGRHGVMASAKSDAKAVTGDAKKEMRSLQGRHEAARAALHGFHRGVRQPVVGDHGDDLAEPDRAARDEHARHPPDRADRPARVHHEVDHVRLRGRRRGDDAASPAPGQPDGAGGLPRAGGQRGDQVRAGRHAQRAGRRSTW